MKIDYNELAKLKRSIEELYTYLQRTHHDFLKVIENAECVDDDKFDQFHSSVKEYESKMELLKSEFLSLSSENKKIESCFSQVKLLKKKRLTKIESNIRKVDMDDLEFTNDGSDYDDLPF